MDFKWLLVGMFCWSAIVRAQDDQAKPLTAAEVKDIPMVGVTELEQKPSRFEGKVIRLRFNSRSTNRLKPEGDKLIGYFRETTRPRGETIDHGAGMVAELPKEAALWYWSLTTLFAVNPPKTVFARVVHHEVSENERAEYRVQVLGREIRNGLKGPEFVWPPFPGGDAYLANLNRELAKDIPKLSVIEVKEHGEELTGRLVQLEFSYRDDRFNNSVGMLYDIGQRFENKALEWVSAVIPPQGNAWYQHIPRGSEGRKAQSVYVKVLGQPDELNEVEKAMNYGIRVEVLGRQMRTGLKGPEFSW